MIQEITTTLDSLSQSEKLLALIEHDQEMTIEKEALFKTMECLKARLVFLLDNKSFTIRQKNRIRDRLSSYNYPIPENFIPSERKPHHLRKRRFKQVLSLSS